MAIFLLVLFQNMKVAKKTAFWKHNIQQKFLQMTINNSMLMLAFDYFNVANKLSLCEIGPSHRLCMH